MRRLRHAARGWWTDRLTPERRQVIGLVLMTLTVGALLAAALPFLIQTGHGRFVEGVVTSGGFAEDYTGSYPRVIAELPGGRRVSVGLQRGEVCAIGDRITILEQPMLFERRRYKSAANACRRPVRVPEPA